jgi:CDP-glucose 4,6-dehydratase
VEGVAVSEPGVWRRRRVLVTGCTGFLGARLTEWLVAEGADVVGLVRDGVPRSNFYRMRLDEHVTTVRGEIESFDIVERVLNEYEIEVVFHLAAQTLVGIANENPRSTFSANIMGTCNVLEAARRARRILAVVVASSDKAYGTQEELPYREDAGLVGRHPYDVSKSCADLIAQMYWHSYGVPVAVTRCGNFYGGGDLNFNRIVPGTIRSLVDGESPVIRSDGTLQRDYLYIKDAVAAYALLAEKVLGGEGKGEAFNFSNEHPRTVLEVVDHIARLMGRSDLPPRILGQATNEIPNQFLSAAKARAHLGWKPQYSLEQGLVETIAWYREFLAR